MQGIEQIATFGIGAKQLAAGAIAGIGQGKADKGLGHGKALDRIGHSLCFGAIGAHEFQPRRRGVKQIAQFNHRATA